MTRISIELKKKITTNEIANKIDELVRSKRGEYTMEEIADNLGSYRQYLYNLRRGKFELKISLLYELSRFFEFDFLGWLAGQDYILSIEEKQSLYKENKDLKAQYKKVKRRLSKKEKQFEELMEKHLQSA